MYEMEQVLPGVDPEDFDSDPIVEANELRDRGQRARARKLLEGLLVKDVRCLDAHAHLEIHVLRWGRNLATGPRTVG
jgi:hypothetical protein